MLVSISRLISRMAWITFLCPSWVPCEKLRRNTSTPAFTSSISISLLLLAGPTVATILVLLNA